MARAEITTADLARRLDILISILAEGLPPAGTMKTSAKIHRLKDLGLSASEIAGIVGKSLNYVSATLHQRRKREE